MRILEDIHRGNEGAMKKFRDCLERLEEAQREEMEVFGYLADALEEDYPSLRE
jgi:hypothetical protein